MRKTFVIAGVALACAGAALIGTHPANAAAMSTGIALTGNQANTSFGGFTCADIQGGSLTPATKVQAYACNADPNQQWEMNGLTIYGNGGHTCLDVYNNGTTAGTKVDSYTCTGSVNQEWYYYNGWVIALNSGLCLDAGNLANGTQLVVNTCTAAASQKWQFK